MKRQRWKHRIIIAVGIWVLCSPWTVPYLVDAPAAVGTAAWSHLIAGAAVTLTGLSAFAADRVWKDWTGCILGVWLVVSPWVLGFADITALTVNAALTGAIVVVLSSSVLLAAMFKRLESLT